MNAVLKPEYTAQNAHAPCRVLVVDDDQRVAESLQALLSTHGHQVDTVFGGRAALHQLSSTRYEVVLLDLAMPDVDGHAVLRYLQTQPDSALAIVVSGENSVTDVSRALRTGAYDYIHKPFQADQLLTTVNNAAARKRLQDAHQQAQQQLQKSATLHRYLIENSPDLVFVLNSQGHFSFVNQRAEELLGLDADNLLGRHVLALVNEEDQEKVRYLLETLHVADDNQRSVDARLLTRGAIARHRHFEITMSRIATQSELARDFGDYHEIYGIARDISERIEAEEFINFQAYHDILTRLPNRSLFKDRLSVAISQAQRSQEKLAVMFIDLDRFKLINDSLGHTMGDRLLQAVGQRLQQCIRKGDTLSRFGGDEFTLLLPNIAHDDAATHVAEKILSAIKEPFLIAEHEIYIGASIGIAVYPDAGDNLEALIKNADIAMYRIKNSGKNGSILFNAEMNGSVTRRHALEQDLRKALQNNELEICYQPLVDTKNSALYGVEALIRWNHPRYGRLSPDEFISVAEDSRLIVDIDRQTLRLACLHVGQMHREGHAGLRLSVNLSPVLVEREDFVDHILETVQDTGFPAHLLQMEITEGLLLNDRHDIIDKLTRLTRSGVTLAIDDFGTGFSSLSYLRKFPISTLKIDRSFVQKLHSQADDACIVSAIVSMAQGLRMNIVAEGVEHVSQFNYLRSLGCHVVQGFLFGAAGTLDDVRTRYPARSQ